MFKQIDHFYEAILNYFGYTQSKRRVNNIFTTLHITENRLNTLKKNLDKISINIIEALVFLAKNKQNKIIKSKKAALYSKLYNMSLFHKIYYRLIYKIPFYLPLLPEVFYHKCGLNFLNKQEITYIKNKPVITAGAYYGDSSLVLYNIAKSKVYGFEPNKHNYKLFEKLIKKNNKEEVIIPIKKGLDSNTGFSYINDNEVSCCSKLTDNIEIGNKIDIITIDDFIEQNNITNLGIIHLDVEGFETNVILGAKKVISMYRPVLLISIYHNEKDFFDLKPLIESWNLDYNFKIRKLARNRFEILLIAIPNIS